MVMSRWNCLTERTIKHIPESEEDLVDVEGDELCCFRICDYSANTKNVVDFHEQNHHLDQSLTQLRRNAILAPDFVKVSGICSDLRTLTRSSNGHVNVEGDFASRLPLRYFDASRMRGAARI